MRQYGLWGCLALVLGFAACKHAASEGASQTATARTDAAAREAASGWVIAGGTVLTMDSAYRVIEHGAVAVEGEKIVAVGPAAELLER